LVLWDGGNAVNLTMLRKTAKGVKQLAKVKLIKGRKVPLAGLVAKVSAGDELVFLPRIEGMFTGGSVTLRDLNIGFGSGGGTVWRLPRAWEGVGNGSSEGNPICVDKKPVWRLDQLWPDNPIIAGNYRPLVWTGARWGAGEHAQGGQPGVTVADGTFSAGVRGPWGGKGMNHQKTAGLVFIAPKSGVYRVKGVAYSKPWEGKAKVMRVGVFKKDAQRAVRLKLLELPRDAKKIPLELTVELTAGHELIFLPLMPDWHNATKTTIADLSVTLQK